MYLQKWRIGIDLSLNKIQLVAAKKQRDRWYLCECWQQDLPATIFNEITPIILQNILTKWRQKLPKSCDVRLAFPLLRTIKHQFVLSEHISTKEPEFSWYIQSQTKKQFPMNADELIFDYQIIAQNVYLSGARKSDIIFWSDLLKICGFDLTTIDIAPNALRYAAQYAGIPDDSWLIYYRDNEWLWAGPTHQPGCYNYAVTAEVPTFSQLIDQLPTDSSTNTLPIYYIGDKCEPAASQHWQLHQAFYQLATKLPHQLGDFVIAARLTLRPEDK
ncbi:pilus assembly protein PilM [Moellerella wisconsensis]|uniref:pilus assembly protein PilM n=1 Tax=Moellerella wisconsensis TaxID=158849 RepID=UPI0030761058